MEGVDNHCEATPGRKHTMFLLAMLATSVALLLLVLHFLSCFAFMSECPCVVDAGSYGESKLSVIDSAGIYAFESASSDARNGQGGATAMKARYNLRVSDDEGLLSANPNLRKLWTSKDWRIRAAVFSDVFQDMMARHLLKPEDNALCIGAGKGHEVLALKELGIRNSIGIDVVASPPLVMKGGLHGQPFKKNTFDFEFSCVFDHALFTSMFAAEIERTLKPGGFVVLHLMLQKMMTEEAHMHKRLQSVDVLIALFKNFDKVHVGSADALGLDTQVVFRKRDKSLDG